MLKLILPEEKYWQSFQLGLDELKKYPTPYDTNGIRSGLNFVNFSDFKTDCENDRLGIGLKEGYVKQTRLWLIKDDKFVGAFDIRHNLTEKLKREGGNIAYYIIPSFRKKGLATSGLKLCCKYAKDVLEFLCSRLNAEPVLAVGKVLILYRKSNVKGVKHILE